MDICPQGSKGKARDIAAAQLGKSGRNLQRKAKLLKEIEAKKAEIRMLEGCGHDDHRGKARDIAAVSTRKQLPILFKEKF